MRTLTLSTRMATLPAWLGPKDDDDRRGDTGTTTVVKPKTKAKPKLEKPKLYKVLLHNDHYTTRDFVVEILKSIFNKPETEAVQIMMHVHQNGVGVAGVFTFEVAETKVETVIEIARQNEFPLMCSMEPAE